MAGRSDCGSALLVADGDAVSRALVVETLKRAGLPSCEATTGFEALALAESVRPCLVLLAVELSGITGYEVCSELRGSFGDDLPIVFLSATRVEALDRIAGLLIGADDYIVKPFEPGELLARIRSLLRRRRNGNETGEPSGRPDLDSLTPRERDVLGLLARGRSQSEIAHELFISPKTVATHIQHVLSKLDVHSRAQAVALALRHGPIADHPPGSHAAPVTLDRVRGTLAAVPRVFNEEDATVPPLDPEPEIVGAERAGSAPRTQRLVGT